MFSYHKYEYEYDDNFIQNLISTGLFIRTSPHAFRLRDTKYYILIWSGHFSWYDGNFGIPIRSVSFEKVFDEIPNKQGEGLLFHLELFIRCNISVVKTSISQTNNSK